MDDLDDRHVLACANYCKADQIVTNNLKYFPKEYLRKFDLRALNADDCLADTIDLNPQLAFEAFKELVRHRRNPNQNVFQVLSAMRRKGLRNSADYLHALIP